MHPDRRLTRLAHLLLAGGLAAWSCGQPGGVDDAADEPALRFRIELGALNLDPLTMVDVESRKVATLLHSGLVQVQQDGTVEARLASSWERVSDRVWRFGLRDGVRFAGGAEVGAEAVVQSLCAAMQPGALWAWSLDAIASEPDADGSGVRCTGLRAPSDNVVEIEETTPTDWLLEALAGPGGWIVPAAEAAGEYGIRPGIGPYVVESFRPGADVTLVAREDGGGVVSPAADRIVFRHLPDPVAAARAFADGDLDLIRIDSPQSYETLVEEGESGANRLRAPGTLLRHPFSRMRIVFVGEASLEQRGFSASQIRRFRRAFSAAIDRDRLARRAPGDATPWFNPFPPAGAGATALSPLAETDRPFDGASLTLLVNNDPYSDSIAAALPSELAGAAISYRAVDFSVIVGALQDGSYDLVSVLIDATIDVPAFWAAFFRPGAPFLLFGKALPDLTDVSVHTAEGVQEAARIVAEQGNWVPLYREEGLIAVGPRLAGLSLTPGGQVSLETVSVRQ